MPFDPWGESWGGAWGSSWLQPDAAADAVDPDVTLSIREAILAEPEITALLATFAGTPAVFTSEPVPGQAVYPMIVINGNIRRENQDGLLDYRPVLAYEIAVHGLNSAPAVHYRAVGEAAYAVRTLFHRARNLSLDSWDVVDQACQGPDDRSGGQFTTRVVTLTVRVAQLANA